MTAAASIEDRISDAYGDLSAKLRTAADYVAGHPVEVATRSLRSLAQTSGVSPATFSRLARALGFADYEEMREAGRAAVGAKLAPFSERARALRGDGDAADLLHRQAGACVSNIAYLEQNTPAERLEAAADALHAAPKVLLIASLGSTGVLDAFGYQAGWFKPGWRVAGRDGASAAASLSRMAPGDVVFALIKTPYARRTMTALETARANGLTTVVVTDGHGSPALGFADHGFVVPTDGANFFSSYVATMVLLETIMAMLLRKSGDDAERRIRDTEDHLDRMGENWPA
ncbi:MAG: MurR/RpiR family transcriptional regulator [Pseudomonadota bacterium]